MIRARTPLDEASRLESLEELRIVGTPHEEAFDRIVRLTAHALEAPHVYLSFLGSDCEWFKAGHEWTFRELPRDESLAAYAILGAGPFIIEDLACETRYPTHLLAQEGIKAYAAVPVRGPSGGNVGILAVLYRESRVFRRDELDALADLARLTEDALALRRAPSMETERERLAMRLALDSQPAPVAVLDRQGIQRHCNEAWRHHSIAGTPIDPLDRAGRDHARRLADAEGPLQDLCRTWARQVRDVLEGERRFAEMEWQTAGPSPRVFHATAERVGSGEDTWVIVQHEDRTMHARTQRLDDESLEAALVQDDLAAERERRDRVLESFMRRTSGIATPLAIHAHLLRVHPAADTGRQQKAVEAILRGLERWNDAVAELRRRLADPAQEDADLSQITREAVESARSHALRMGITLHAKVGDDPLQVRLGSDDARRMVDALLDRALRATPAGGTVRIGCRLAEGKAVVEVEDMGEVPANADQVFDPVGLHEEPERAPLVRLRALAESAHGWSWVNARPEGLQLGFTLPLGEALAKEAAHQHP